MRQSKSIVWGIILVAMGFIWGLNAIGVTRLDITLIDGWWTFFIIIPCFAGLLHGKDKKGNIIGLSIGIALFLCCRGMLDFSWVWKLTVPFILVAVGLSYIFRDALPGRMNQEIKRLSGTVSEDQEYCATFSEQHVDFDGEEFRGASLTSVFGDLKCDLKQSAILEDQVINASAVFGGITIYVPDEINVKIRSTSMFGGASDKRKRNYIEGNRTIYINATCMFGGIEIR